jgi:CheY-specific phosphatase CheX
MTDIEQEAFTTMERHLVAATIELFDSYGVPVQHTGSNPELQPTSDDRSVVAVIGYAGEKVRGALVMVASRPVVESWLVSVGETTADICDTLGEFSNMLLGRLKGRLLPEGFPILLSTPTTAFGGALRMSRPVRPSTWLAFSSPSWKFDLRIDATFEDGFALQAREARETPAEAGDMMLF